MKKFLDDNFLLENKTSEVLYHTFAKKLPVIDYHCHIPPGDIVNDIKYDNLTQVWLYGDHYKWRAMRANGIDEKFITGNASDKDKFVKWAETVPMTIRNPLYHWTHLELKRFFGIDELLSPGTADKIYEKVSEMLRQDDFSVKNLIRKMNVEVICTTDDPTDSLEHHEILAQQENDFKVYPTWRPDKAMAVENAESFNTYADKLEEVTSLNIIDFERFLEALEIRHDFFNEHGCQLSDHGLETIYAEDYDEREIRQIFKKIRSGDDPDSNEVIKFKSAMLEHLAIMDHEKGWTQQFHIGAIRNNNSRMFEKIGPDTGFDAIGNFEHGKATARFLDSLEKKKKLTKTILYNLNPADFEMLTSILYCFNDGSVPGKMQIGSGWWFLDQKKGMTHQIDTLSNLGLLSHFVGMLTDSRSFLSYPRHEYFRRILSNIIGTDIEKGEIPDDIDMAGKMVSDISYYNAKKYFGF